MVVRFTPIGAHLFLGLPMHLIANEAVDLELIDPALARVLVSRIVVAGSWTDRFTAMESLIAGASLMQRYGGAIQWADVAADCGYFDQAHLIKDFQEFAGRTPDAFLRQVSFLN